MGRLRTVGQLWSEWLLCSCFLAWVRRGSAALEGISGKWCHRWLPAPREEEPRQSATTTPRYWSRDYFLPLYFDKQLEVVFFNDGNNRRCCRPGPLPPEPNGPYWVYCWFFEPCQGSSNGKSLTEWNGRLNPNIWNNLFKVHCFKLFLVQINN